MRLQSFSERSTSLGGAERRGIVSAAAAGQHEAVLASLGFGEMPSMRDVVLMQGGVRFPERDEDDADPLAGMEIPAWAARFAPRGEAGGGRGDVVSGRVAAAAAVALGVGEGSFAPREEVQSDGGGRSDVARGRASAAAEAEAAAEAAAAVGAGRVEGSRAMVSDGAVLSYRIRGASAGQPELVIISESDNGGPPHLQDASGTYSGGPPSLLASDNDSYGGPPPLASSDNDDEDGPLPLVASSGASSSNGDDDRPPPLAASSGPNSSNGGDGGWETMDSGEGDQSTEDEEDGWETTSESGLPAGMPLLPARAANAPPGRSWIRILELPGTADALPPVLDLGLISSAAALSTPLQVSAQTRQALLTHERLPPAARANADSSIRLARPARHSGAIFASSAASPFHSTPTFLSRGGRPLGRPGGQPQLQPSEGQLPGSIGGLHARNVAPMQTPTVSGHGPQQQQQHSAGGAASEPRATRGGAGRAWLQTVTEHWQQYGYSGPDDARLPPASGSPRSQALQEGGSIGGGTGSTGGTARGRAVRKAWPPPPALSAAARAALSNPEALMAEVLRRLQPAAGGGRAVDGSAPCVRDALVCLNRAARHDKQSPWQLLLGGGSGGHHTPGPVAEAERQ